MERKTEKICPRNDKIVKILTPGDLLYPNMRKDNGPTKTSVYVLHWEEEEKCWPADIFFLSNGLFSSWGRGVRNRNSQNTDIAGPLPGFVNMHWGPSKVIIHHPKVIISPQKCPFFPQKPHIFNIFPLKNDLRTFVVKYQELHLRAFVGQIRQEPGWGGGQTNSRNARISLTFSLTKMIYALLSKNVTSRIRKGASIRGRGDQPNFLKRDSG